MIGKKVTFEMLDELNDQRQAGRREILIQSGWSIRHVIGGIWLWSKEVPGGKYTCDMETALNVERALQKGS